MRAVCDCSSIDASYPHCREAPPRLRLSVTPIADAKITAGKHVLPPSAHRLMLTFYQSISHHDINVASFSVNEASISYVHIKFLPSRKLIKSPRKGNCAFLLQLSAPTGPGVRGIGTSSTIHRHKRYHPFTPRNITPRDCVSVSKFTSRGSSRCLALVISRHPASGLTFAARELHVYLQRSEYEIYMYICVTESAQRERNWNILAGHRPSINSMITHDRQRRREALGHRGTWIAVCTIDHAYVLHTF